MSMAPDPSEIYARAEEEGHRRLSMSLLEKTTTAFIAGVTIIFGTVALAVVEGLANPELPSGLAQILGALAFPIGLALPTGAPEALISAAEELTAKSWSATLARAVMAGALVTLLSYLLKAVNTVTSRILVTYFAGFILALGPFDHVVVSALHLLFGIWLGGPAGYDDLFTNMGLATVGNLVGGLFLMTFTHTAQVKGTRGGD